MEGVMIYIVIYKEVSIALPLDSAHTKSWLQLLHPNIKGLYYIFYGIFLKKIMLHVTCIDSKSFNDQFFSLC
jgi:hypothetical protein